jgi:hypothetical protein
LRVRYFPNGLALGFALVVLVRALWTHQRSLVLLQRRQVLQYVIGHRDLASLNYDLRVLVVRGLVLVEDLLRILNGLQFFAILRILTAAKLEQLDEGIVGHVSALAFLSLVLDVVVFDI